MVQQCETEELACRRTRINIDDGDDPKIQGQGSKWKCGSNEHGIYLTIGVSDFHTEACDRARACRGGEGRSGGGGTARQPLGAYGVTP